MIGRLACNYAVIRFVPYPETEEFVNVGVVVHCPRTGFFDFKIERRKCRRIANFFPELQMDVYRAAIRGFREEATRLRDEIGVFGADHTSLLLDRDLPTVLFKELIRPREAIVRCGEPRTILVDTPHVVLEQLFAQYVERLFAREKDFQEKVMRKRLAECLRRWHLLRFYKQEVPVGDEEYAVRFPFVYKGQEPKETRAIKPLNLAQDTSTAIYDHGEQWVARLNRLRRMNLAPASILFTVKAPSRDERRHAAFSEVCGELQKFAVVVPEAAEDEIKRFATVPEALPPAFSGPLDS